MTDLEILRQAVIHALKKVIDPETGTDVVRMRFRPSSPLCPIALTLIMSIIEAVKAVDGINDQKITVIDYTGADELNAILATLPLSRN